MFHIPKWASAWQAVESLFFPSLCCGCEKLLLQHETYICTHCAFSLPFTDFHLIAENDSLKQFWGKAAVSQATSMLFYYPHARIGQMLHKIKYQNKPLLATYFGEMYAEKLRKVASYQSLDYLIPIPLHPKKLKKRGYNQAGSFGIGLARTLGIPLLENVLIRTTHSASQTQKTRLERFDNIENVFAVKNSAILENKRIALIDDVLTTGATIVSAANRIHQSVNCDISVITLARAKM